MTPELRVSFRSRAVRSTRVAGTHQLNADLLAGLNVRACEVGGGGEGQRRAGGAWTRRERVGGGGGRFPPKRAELPRAATRAKCPDWKFPGRVAYRGRYRRTSRSRSYARGGTCSPRGARVRSTSRALVPVDARLGGVIAPVSGETRATRVVASSTEKTRALHALRSHAGGDASVDDRGRRAVALRRGPDVDTPRSVGCAAAGSPWTVAHAVARAGTRRDHRQSCRCSRTKNNDARAEGSILGRPASERAFDRSRRRVQKKPTD